MAKIYEIASDSFVEATQEIVDRLNTSEQVLGALMKASKLLNAAALAMAQHNKPQQIGAKVLLELAIRLAQFG